MFQRMLRPFLTVGFLVPLLAAGCGTEADVDGILVDDEGNVVSEDDQGQSEDALEEKGTKARFLFLQAGFFKEYPDPPGRVPRLLHFGFVTGPGNTWAGVTDVPITYSAGKNKGIYVTPPAAYQDRLLAYTIKYEERGSYGSAGSFSWTPDAYVDLKSPAGKFLYFPVQNIAPYPFENECYRIQVRGPRDGALGPSYPGKVKSINYGLTTATIAQWEQNPDVPWIDYRGRPGDIGTLPAAHRHDGGYKGAYRMVPLWTRVPTGKRLVFKLRIDKFYGQCGYSGDSQFNETVWTQTYLWPNPPPLLGP